MKVYGLVNVPLAKVVDVYGREDEAERALERVLADEPTWAAEVAVHELELELHPERVRLRSVGAALIDLSYAEVPTTGVAEAPPSLVAKPKRRQPRRRTSSNG